MNGEDIEKWVRENGSLFIVPVDPHTISVRHTAYPSGKQHAGEGHNLQAAFDSMIEEKRRSKAAEAEGAA
jgi:hypothetical protein